MIAIPTLTPAYEVLSHPIRRGVSKRFLEEEREWDLDLLANATKADLEAWDLQIEFETVLAINHLLGDM